MSLLRSLWKKNEHLKEKNVVFWERNQFCSKKIGPLRSFLKRKCGLLINLVKKWVHKAKICDKSQNMDPLKTRFAFLSIIWTSIHNIYQTAPMIILHLHMICNDQSHQVFTCSFHSFFVKKKHITLCLNRFSRFFLLRKKIQFSGFSGVTVFLKVEFYSPKRQKLFGYDI